MSVLALAPFALKSSGHTSALNFKGETPAQKYLFKAIYAIFAIHELAVSESSKPPSFLVVCNRWRAILCKEVQDALRKFFGFQPVLYRLRRFPKGSAGLLQPREVLQYRGLGDGQEVVIADHLLASRTSQKESFKHQ